MVDAGILTADLARSTSDSTALPGVASKATGSTPEHTWTSESTSNRIDSVRGVAVDMVEAGGVGGATPLEEAAAADAMVAQK